jgi:hypothetical protein
MTPEDAPTKRELDREEFEQAAIDWVKKNAPIETLFDFYDHDKAVAISFKTFVSCYMNGEITDEEPNKNISDDGLWELFCNRPEETNTPPDNDLPLHEGEEFKL